MNLNIVRKKNPYCVKLDWSEKLFDELDLSDLDLETIVLTIVDFELKSTVKDIVIAHYKGTPIYVTISRKNIHSLIKWLLAKFSEKEKYEVCHQLNVLRYDNN